MLLAFDMSRFADDYARAWSSQDPGSVAAFFADGGSLKVNDGQTAVGRDEIAEVALSFMTAFPDMVVTMDDYVEKPNCEAEFHWTLTGTNNGPGGTGQRVRISGYEEWSLDSNGLVTHSLGHFDAAEYERQLKKGV